MYANLPASANTINIERSDRKKAEEPYPTLVRSVGGGTGTGCQTDAQPALALTSSELIVEVDYNPLVKVDDGRLRVSRTKNVSGHSVELTQHGPAMK